MIKFKYTCILALTVILSCDRNRSVEESFTSSEIIVENSTPTVNLEKYTLIQNTTVNLTNEATEIIKLKRKWPLAMQSQNPEAFDSILADDFTFKGIGEFFNRKAYIENRVKPDEWKITFVKYENVCLEFINENLAILSYKNRIKNVNPKTNEIEFENISWVDIYTKDKNNWKIKSAHAIDYRLEK